MRYVATWDEWVPDEELEKLKLERVVAPELTNAELAYDILSTSAPAAAQSVAWLALHAGQEAIRLKASQYIIDGVVGGGFKGASSGIDDMLVALVRQLSENDEISQPRH